MSAPPRRRRPLAHVSDAADTGTPNWDIGRPQRAFVRPVDAGLVRSPVLDVGCGTGELSLFLARHGHDVLGVDLSAVAIRRARWRRIPVWSSSSGTPWNGVDWAPRSSRSGRRWIRRCFTSSATGNATSRGRTRGGGAARRSLLRLRGRLIRRAIDVRHHPRRTPDPVRRRRRVGSSLRGRDRLRAAVEREPGVLRGRAPPVNGVDGQRPDLTSRRYRPRSFARDRRGYRTRYSARSRPRR